MAREIYKYIAVNMNALNILVNGNLFFTPPDELNDLFEGEFNFPPLEKMPPDEWVSRFCTTENIPKEEMTLERLNTEVKRSHKADQQNSHGITCFSKVNHNVLMWSHYADANKGICLAFNQKKLLDGIKKVYSRIEMKKVKYLKDFPNRKLTLSGQHLWIEVVTEMYTVKMLPWKSEEELRLIYQHPSGISNRNIPFPLESITGVIFGPKTSEQNISILSNIVSQNPKLNNIKLFQASPDVSMKKMKITPFTRPTNVSATITLGNN